MPLSPKARTLLVVFACLLTIGFMQAATANAAPSRAEARLLRLINNARVSHGRAKVRFGSTIQTDAHKWARYLRRHDAFYHGRMAVGTSENIGWLTCRRGWARTFVRWWLNSPAHRANLLDRSAHRAGIGVAVGSWQRYSCVRMSVTRFR